MSTTKAGGKTRQHPPRPGKRLGFKVFADQPVSQGSIIIRQRGTLFYSGSGTMLARDHSIFALKSGVVKIKISRGKKYLYIV